MSLMTLAARAALVASVLAAPLVASATIVLPRTVEEMATGASTVVRAKVVARQSAWDADHRRIHTYTELAVLETVTGEAPKGALVVRTMGGAVGDIGMRVAGVAKFEVGEEVVVFLRVDPLDASHFQVIGMSQGKYTVDRSGGAPVAVASVEGLAFARRTAEGKLSVDGHTSDLAGRVPLVDLVARVRAAKAGRGATPVAPSAPAGPSTPSTPATTGTTVGSK